MSGAYLVQDPGRTDLDRIAEFIAAQLVYGHEPVNHYFRSSGTLVGFVSQDKFGQGVMPRYLPCEGLWGILEGELHQCDCLDRLRKENPSSSDLELFAQLYQADMLIENLPKLNGAFFVILWEPASDTVVAFNDRYGLYPMYWSHRQGRFCLASRVLCSVLADVVDGCWNLAGVVQLLTTEDYMAGTTLVEDVEAFPQASVMMKQGDVLSWRSYWHYEYPSEESARAGFSDIAREVGERLVQAVRRQCSGHGRVGVTLSGGLDSRCLVAAATKAGVPVQTFTWGKADAYDRRFARNVASIYETEHHDCDYEFDHLASRYEQGIRITEGLNNYLDCHMLAHLHILGEHSDLILNGYAGDLVLGGSYVRRTWLDPAHCTDLAGLLFAWRNTVVPEAQLDAAVPELSRLDADELPSARFSQLISAIPDMATPDLVDRFFLEHRVRRQTSMGTVIMRCAVESAAPFFEYDFLDLATSIPARWRHEHRIYKAMMRQAFPEALGVRWQRTLLPASAPLWVATTAKAYLKLCRLTEARIGWPGIASRQSPVDFSKLLRGPLRSWMDTIVRENHPTADEVLKPTFCERVWEEHLAGQDRTRVLGAIAALRGFSRVLDQARTKSPARIVAPAAIRVENS